MTESDIDLFERYLTDELSAEEKTALAQRLDSDPEFQAAFVGYLEESQDLRVMLSQAKAEETIDSPSFSMASSARRRFQPLGAAAAIGLLLGGVMTSAVWAFAVPKIPKVSRIPVPLVDPRFEEVVTPLPAVHPRSIGSWNGDPSHLAVSSEEVSAKTKMVGRSMLKMQPVDERRYSRLEQIVRVEDLVPAEGGAVDFSVDFFCDNTVHQSRAILVVRAFSLSGDEIEGSTRDLQDEVTSTARKAVFLSPEMTSWQREKVRMDLPPGTKTLVFAIVAIDAPKGEPNASQYIDNVRAAILATNPDEN